MRLGKFEKKLLLTFLCGSILLFALPLTALVMSNAMFSRQQYVSTVKQSVDRQMELSELYFSAISSIVYDLSTSPNVYLWGNSQVGTPLYYDYAYRVLKEEQQATVAFSASELKLGIMRADEESFVITPMATVPKKDFLEVLEENYGDGVKVINEHFKISGAALTLPIYKENRLSEILYVTSRKGAGGDDLLFAVFFPADMLFTGDTPFILKTAEDKGFFSHQLEYQPIFETVYRATQEHTQEHPEAIELKIENQVVEIRDFRNNSWQIAYLYKDPSPSFISLFLWCLLLFVSLSALLFLASRLLTKTLYKPLRQLLYAYLGSDGTVKNQGLDEFAVLTSSVGRLSELTSEVALLIRDKEELAETKKGRDLLFGTSNLPVIKADFCVGLIEITAGNEGQLLMQKNIVESCAGEIEGARFVNCGVNCVAVIFQGQQEGKAYNFLEGIMSSLGEGAHLYGALSDGREGSDSICRCYNQALQILEFKHLFPEGHIITASEISKASRQSYRYPLQTEGVFIQALISGNAHGLVIFDRIIDENMVQLKLSPEMVKSFVLALISSISRTFQTMKVTPEEILGYDVDFLFLYQHWNDKDLMKRLRRLVEDILSAAQERSQDSDDRLIQEMQDYIHKNFADNIMLEDMAQAFRITPKYCSALFKKLSDDTFKNYLNRYRIEVAKEVLEREPEVKIQDLSVRVGFNSSNSFIRVFSRYTGETPKAYYERFHMNYSTLIK